MGKGETPTSFDRLHQIDAGDAWFVPEGVPHRYFNITDEPARAVFGVAPRYLPADG